MPDTIPANLKQLCTDIKYVLSTIGNFGREEMTVLDAAQVVEQAAHNARILEMSKRESN